MNFAAGYGLAIVQWVQLYFVCELGENIQVISFVKTLIASFSFEFHERFYSIFKDNGFGKMLYEVEWELLPTDIQSSIMLIIRRNQYGNGLKFGPFENYINRETFRMVLPFAAL